MKRTKRHKLAIEIQLGAINPSNIAREVIEACREVLEEGFDAKADAAVRLMSTSLPGFATPDTSTAI